MKGKNITPHDTRKLHKKNETLNYMSMGRYAQQPLQEFMNVLTKKEIASTFLYSWTNTSNIQLSSWNMVTYFNSLWENNSSWSNPNIPFFRESVFIYQVFRVAPCAFHTCLSFITGAQIGRALGIPVILLLWSCQAPALNADVDNQHLF